MGLVYFIHRFLVHHHTTYVWTSLFSAPLPLRSLPILLFGHLSGWFPLWLLFPGSSPWFGCIFPRSGFSFPDAPGFCWVYICVRCRIFILPVHAFTRWFSHTGRSFWTAAFLRTSRSLCTHHTCLSLPLCCTDCLNTVCWTTPCRSRLLSRDLPPPRHRATFSPRTVAAVSLSSLHAQLHTLHMPLALSPAHRFGLHAPPAFFWFTRTHAFFAVLGRTPLHFVHVLCIFCLVGSTHACRRTAPFFSRTPHAFPLPRSCTSTAACSTIFFAVSSLPSVPVTPFFFVSFIFLHFLFLIFRRTVLVV